MQRYGRGTRRVPGMMNSLEKKYAEYLEQQRRSNYLDWYSFDCLKLRLAEKTFYTPDFLVLRPDDVLEIHEVKGHWEDDARVKIKCAADKFPFKFMAVTLEKGVWKYEDF